MGNCLDIFKSNNVNKNNLNDKLMHIDDNNNNIVNKKVNL